MARITDFYIHKDKFFLTLEGPLKEESILKLGNNVIGYKTLSKHKILILLSDLTALLDKTTQKAQLMTLNEEELECPSILNARDNFRFFKISKDKYLFFDNQGILATLTSSELDLNNYLNKLSIKQVKKIYLTDKRINIIVGASWLYQVENVLIYQGSKRKELPYYIDEQTSSIHISLDSVKDLGMNKLCFDINNSDMTGSYFLSCEEIDNQSDSWITDNKNGFSLTSKALAISFESKDIGVVNCQTEKDQFILSLVSEEVPFEKLVATNQDSGESFDLSFTQEENKIKIDIDSFPQETCGSYEIQAVFFEIYFSFYMPQTTGTQINLSAEKFVYFSKNGRLYFSNTDVSRSVVEDKIDAPPSYQYFKLNNGIVIVSSCTSVNNRTVFAKSLYRYPDNKYVDLNVKSEAMLEAVFQDKNEYCFIFNEDVKLNSINLVHKKIKSQIPLPFYQEDNRKITINLNTNLVFFGDLRADYDLVFGFQDDYGLGGFSVSERDMKGKKAWERYFDAEIVPNNPKNNIATRLYFDKKGKICLLNRAILPTDENVRKIPIQFEIDSISKKKNSLKVLTSYSRKETDSLDRYLKIKKAYLYKTINQTETIDLNIDSVTDNKMILSVPLEELVDKNRLGHYVMVIVVYLMGKTFHLKLVMPSSDYAGKLTDSRFVFVQKVNEKKRVVLPKMGGPRDFTLFVDDFKPIDSRKSIMMENQAVKKYESGKFKEINNQYILFEKEANYAEDNGFALFEWIQENIPDNNSYYVINKNSPHLPKLMKYEDHLLYPGTYKYFKHLLQSKAVVGSENPIHLYDGDRAKISPFMNKVMFKKEVVFLQHGVTAMKNISKFQNFRADSNVIDYFVATNQDEKMTIHNNLGYDYFQIPVLGFARWDKFDFNKKNQQSTILYVPTNRQWLVKATDEEFMNSDYYQGILNLITDKKMQCMLEERNLKLQVFVHPLMQKFTKTITALSPLVEVLSIENNDLGELLRSASLLITDYSSVAWDFAVQRKPVIFYQFDREEYEKKVGSFIDLRSIPIGHSYKKVQHVINDVELITGNDFKIDRHVEKQIDRMFGKYHRNVCAKTYEFINEVSK